MTRRTPTELAAFHEQQAARVRAKAARAEVLRTSKEAAACERAAAALAKAIKFWTTDPPDERIETLSGARTILLGRVIQLLSVKP